MKSLYNSKCRVLLWYAEVFEEKREEKTWGKVVHWQLISPSQCKAAYCFHHARFSGKKQHNSCSSSTILTRFGLVWLIFVPQDENQLEWPKISDTWGNSNGITGGTKHVDEKGLLKTKHVHIEWSAWYTGIQRMYEVASSSVLLY